MSNRKNPYTELQTDAREWARAVLRPTRKLMWIYPREALSKGWPLGELYERVAAAAQMDYRVVLSASDEGLVVKYEELPPPPPWAIAP